MVDGAHTTHPVLTVAAPYITLNRVFQLVCCAKVPRQAGRLAAHHRQQLVSNLGPVSDLLSDGLCGLCDCVVCAIVSISIAVVDTRGCYMCETEGHIILFFSVFFTIFHIENNLSTPIPPITAVRSISRFSLIFSPTRSHRPAAAFRRPHTPSNISSFSCSGSPLPPPPAPHRYLHTPSFPRSSNYFFNSPAIIF